MPAIFEALQELLSVHHFMFLWLGVIVGMVVGILPGMGGTAGMALLLPFVYGMDQSSALALMIGMLATTATGDTFPSILMGIPGGSSSATVLDGFPMARQGHAARALAASFSASLIGGLLGSLVLTACVFIARPLILGVGMGEQLLLVLLALTMVGSLTGRSALKGLAACAIGLMIGAVGSAPATGELRYTFGTVYLSDGIPLVVLALGIFALPEIVDLMRQRTAISSVKELGSGWKDGILDTFRNLWLVFRVSGLGAVIGILPGVGASTADWLAYGHVVQSSKDKSKFGKGDIRGVIAPEAANNAVRGGDLVPTLFFGIPGSGSMALLLGAFILIGLQPGARMVTTNLDVTFLIIWSLAIANIFAAILCIGLAGPIAKLTLVRYALLAPVITVILSFTAYQATRSWGDLITLIGLAIFGMFMKRFDWSRPALVVGFVLSPGLEASIYQTAQVYGLSFVTRPQSIFIAMLVLASLAAGVISMVRADKSSDKEAKPHTRLPQLLFTAVLVSGFIAALVPLSEAAHLTRIYPMGIGIIALLLLGGVVLQQARARLSNPVLADVDQTSGASDYGAPSRWLYIGWFILFLTMVYLLGFTLASGIFIFAFITAECGRPLLRNLAFSVGTIAMLMLLTTVLGLNYPDGLLPRLLNLPPWLM